VERLGSRVWVSSSLQIFAITVGECCRWGGKLSSGGNVQENMSEGERLGGKCAILAVAERAMHKLVVTVHRYNAA